MTRTCAWCGKFIEEVCPECAAPAGRIGEMNLRLRDRIGFYVCLNDECLALVFGTGCGGVTHGICESCAIEQRKEIAAI